jgi:hypothetical protein
MGKIILIKSVETVLVNSHEVYLPVLSDIPMRVYSDSLLTETVSKNLEISREVIRGRRFTNTKGEQVIIGMTKEVQDTIGLSFEAFENMEKERDIMNSVQKETLKSLKKYSDAGFLKRLRYLFTSRI